MKALMLNLQMDEKSRQKKKVFMYVEVTAHVVRYFPDDLWLLSKAFLGTGTNNGYFDSTKSSIN